MGRNSTVRFGSFEFHSRRSELCFEGEPVPLQEQPRKVLTLLLATPGEIVSREQIGNALWDNDHGDHEHGINTAIRKLRRVLDGRVPGLRLETSAGRGYRLLLPAELQGRHQAALDREGLDAFLTGQFLFSQRNPAALLSAKQHFELACELNPAHAIAHASLSRTCRFLTIFEMAPPLSLWQQAELHARRAVELDPVLSEAQSCLAYVLARYRWNWTEGCTAYREALRLNPNDVETLCDYGVALLAMGKMDEGVRQLDRVLVLDPRYAIGRATVALGWMMQGRKAEAVSMLTGMTESMPGFVSAWIYLGIEQLNTGDWMAAEASCRHVLALAPGNPTFLALLAHALAGSGHRDAMRTTVDHIDRLGIERYVSPTAQAMAALAADDITKACKAVREAAAQRDANFALYRRMRLFDPIREMAEFVQTLAAMRL